MATPVRKRAPHTLSKEHQAKIAESDKLRAANPNKVGPDAPKAEAPAPAKSEED